MKHIIDDNDKNKYEALDKAETLAAIQQIIEAGEIPSELLNGIALTLRNPIDGEDYKIAFCTQAKYNELEAQGQLEVNCYYYITDDTTAEELDASIDEIQSDINDINQRLDDLGFSEGVFSVSEGTPATNWIKKQGKYVRGRLELDFVLGAGASKTITITVPSAYNPKENTAFVAGIEMSLLGANQTRSFVYTGLLLNGELTVSVTNSDTYYPRDCRIYLTNIGWEIN